MRNSSPISRRWTSRNLTPHDYGLKVRGSVNGMMVTAPGKMRAGTRVRIGFSGASAETVVMYCDRINGEANFQTVDAFVQSLAAEHGIPQPGQSGNYVWSGVDGSARGRNFFAQFLTPPGAWRVNAPTIAEYIRNRVGAGELVNLDSRPDLRQRGRQASLLDRRLRPKPYAKNRIA